MSSPAEPGRLSLRLSVTDRCQLRCQYCMPPAGVALGPRQEILSYEEISLLVACLQREMGVAKVRLTGGEPLVRPQLERLVARLAGLGVPELTLTTNGLLLASQAAALRRAGLQRVNISLDSLRPAVFRQLSGGGDLQPVLAGIAAAHAHGLTPVKLNTVVVRGVNDTEVATLVDFGLEHDCEVRFIELMPIGPAAAWGAERLVAATEIRAALIERFALAPATTAPDSAARRFTVADAKGRRGTVGFIASCSDPFCAHCARLRVTADGRLIGCLAQDGGVSVRDLVRQADWSAVVDAARQVLGTKRRDGAFAQDLAMVSIGG